MLQALVGVEFGSAAGRVYGNPEIQWWVIDLRLV